jgi:hypothetical protein
MVGGTKSPGWSDSFPEARVIRNMHPKDLTESRKNSRTFKEYLLARLGIPAERIRMVNANGHLSLHGKQWTLVWLFQ